MFSNILDAMMDADEEIPRFDAGSVQLDNGIHEDHGQSYDGLVVTR